MKALGLIGIVLIVVIISYVFIFKQNIPDVIPAIIPTETTDFLSPTEIIRPEPSIDNSDLKQGGSSLSDPAGVYSILYPSDYTFDSQNNGQHQRIYKAGSTQKGQTEMYDGVIMVFEVIMLDNQTLSDWVDNTLKQTTADGTSEVVEIKKPIQINSQPGFTYATRGLGISTYYIVQKNSQSNYAALIATSVNDPQNIGYQKEVDKILSTLEVQK